MELITRIPNLEDAQNVYHLIDRCKPLDLNSEYCYMLLCTHFRATSVVAEIEGRIVGVITGYFKPEDITTLFIWQVAVDEQYRGKKIAKLMLANLFSRENVKIIKKIETTISPTNSASQALFRSVADYFNAKFKTSPFITENMFGNTHEEEVLYTVEPIDLKNYRGEIS